MTLAKGTKEKKVYYSADEWKVICEKAAESGMRTGVYIRWVSLHGEVKKFDNVLVNKLLVEFNRIGRLVNQVARVANESGSVYRNDIETMQVQMERLSAVFKNYLAQFDPEEII